MNNECKDRDLLAIEPEIFAESFESQRLAAGEDGAIAGATFTSASADFAAAQVDSGMIVCVYDTVAVEGRCYEIVSVESQTSLTVSILRPSGDGDPIAPQIRGACETLAEKLRQAAEVEGIEVADYADSPRLRKAISLAALAAIFTARASNAADLDANWVKAEHYRREHLALLPALRLARDADGDGLAEQTRALGNVSLRRV